MHAACNLLNLHSSCEYTVTSSLDVCQVVPLWLIKFFLYSSWMPLLINNPVHTFLNSYLILHMNLKFLEMFSLFICLVNCFLFYYFKLPFSSSVYFYILQHLQCLLTSSFLYMCLLSSFRMISASFLSWAVTSSSSFMMVNTHSHSSVIRCWCSK